MPTIFGYRLCRLIPCQCPANLSRQQRCQVVHVRLSSLLTFHIWYPTDLTARPLTIGTPQINSLCPLISLLSPALGLYLSQFCLFFCQKETFTVLKVSGKNYGLRSKELLIIGVLANKKDGHILFSFFSIKNRLQS